MPFQAIDSTWTNNPENRFANSKYLKPVEMFNKEDGFWFEQNKDGEVVLMTTFDPEAIDNFLKLD